VKIEDRKNAQGFMKDGPKCVNCNYYESEKIERSSPHDTYVEEKRKRCSLGAFATGKTCWCKHHIFSGPSA